MNEEEPNHRPTEDLIDVAGAFDQGGKTDVMPGRWSPPEPKELDRLIPDYEVQQLLGHGGMGAVYKSWDPGLSRYVAIKVLPPEMTQIDPAFDERFRREAQAMAALDHPNIVRVFRIGQTEAGHSWFVMEFIDGMDLFQLIRRGELDHNGALNVVSQICDALEYAHNQGFVHRDIKPANIFINQQGVLKVGDFGLAKIAVAQRTEAPTAPLLTQPGMVMGTPIYSAPEQMDGREVDHRADIYSLGVMFYEMLTGELPRGAFAPPSKKADVDERLDQVVSKAMQSEPADRYPTATEMRTELDEVRSTDAKMEDDGTSSAGGARKRTRTTRTTRTTSKVWIILFIAVLTLLVWVGFSVLFGPEDVSEPNRQGDAVNPPGIPAAAGETEKSRTTIGSIVFRPDSVLMSGNTLTVSLILENQGNSTELLRSNVDGSSKITLSDMSAHDHDAYFLDGKSGADLFSGVAVAPKRPARLIVRFTDVNRDVESIQELKIAFRDDAVRFANLPIEKIGHSSISTTSDGFRFEIDHARFANGNLTVSGTVTNPLAPRLLRLPVNGQTKLRDLRHNTHRHRSFSLHGVSGAGLYEGVEIPQNALVAFEILYPEINQNLAKVVSLEILLRDEILEFRDLPVENGAADLTTPAAGPKEMLGEIAVQLVSQNCRKALFK
ncbi:MAG: serine/threonine-protein kinase [Verrucomicrobiota bacterium]